MGRHEHYEDRSGDSAFLEAFRKRKNERLMSELDLNEETDAPIVKQGESSFRAPSHSSSRKSDNRQPTPDISLRVSEHTTDETRLTDDSYYPHFPFKSEKTEQSSLYSRDDGFTDYSELSGVSLPSEEHRDIVYGKTTKDPLPDNSDPRSADAPDNDPFQLMPSDSADYSAVSNSAPEEKRDSANSTATSFPSKKTESHTGSRTEKPKSAKPRSTLEDSSSSSKNNNAAFEIVRGGEKKKNGNHGILFFLIFLVAVVTMILLIKSRVNKNSSIDNSFYASSSAINDEYSYNVYSTESDNVSDENTSEEMSSDYSSDFSLDYSSDLTSDLTSDLSSVGSEAELSSNVESTESTAPFKFRKLNKGSEGEEVKIMQERLAELGYMSTQSCTGFYGDITVKKVKEFQKKAGLKVTGKADVKTLERLFAADAPLCG